MFLVTFTFYNSGQNLSLALFACLDRILTFRAFIVVSFYTTYKFYEKVKITSKIYIFLQKCIFFYYDCYTRKFGYPVQHVILKFKVLEIF